MKFSYTRQAEPNYKIKIARCRCKSYRSYKCTAKLEIREIECIDKYFLSDYHSQNCITMNCVKSETAGDTQSNFEDITILVKKRCAEVALDKIWLTAGRVWEKCGKL